ncbi:HAD family hydrolase [Thermodesulfobacteriota bacterium]
MNNITAIGFDLFNTLITVEPQTLSEAMCRLIGSLRKSGFSIEKETFKKTYRETAVRFVERARQDGRETHNSIWISSALEDGGDPVSSDDARIGEAVEHYFSAFYDNCRLIPGTEKMLGALQGRYSLGLLSNFTHGPAAREILKRTGLVHYFKTILISGELGFRKPHPMVFQKLVEQLGAGKDQILYIGDDPAPDIHGAQRAGLQPVWSTYVRDNKFPMVPGILRGDLEKPDFEVPTISSWQDLFTLLDKK